MIFDIGIEKLDFVKRKKPVLNGLFEVVIFTGFCCLTFRMFPVYA